MATIRPGTELPRTALPDGGPDRPSAPLRRRTGKPIRTAVGVLILAVFLFPVYWMVNAALQGSENLLTTSWFPTHISFAGFSRALSSQGGNLVTSLVIALGSVVVCLLVSAPAAYGLSQTRLRGGAVFAVGLLITQMIPGIVIANGLYSLYSDLGLINSRIGLVLADASLGIPFSILLIRAFMLNIPRSLIEAAYVDGASRLRAFVSIVIPISRNALITAGLFSFLFAWSDFLFALTLTTNGKVTPITLGMYQFLGAHTQSWSTLMASAVLASIPAAALLVGAQKFIASGVTGGAVK
jgi:multiple sugar transport system permease protein